LLSNSRVFAFSSEHEIETPRWMYSAKKEILLAARQNQALRPSFPPPGNDQGSFLFSSQVRHHLADGKV
jgi:hypothetical protein